MNKKKKIIMTVSENGYKNLRLMMRKLGFKDEDLFLKFCTLTTLKKNLNKIKPNATLNEKKRINEELKMTYSIKK